MSAFDNIPDELRQLIQWVCWRYIKRDDNEKPTKVPYDPRSGKLASSTDRKTWSSFAECLSAHLAKQYDGIGFVFAKGGGYVGIDLDDCEDDQQAFNRQQQIYNFIPPTYAEFSPSGKGST